MVLFFTGTGNSKRVAQIIAKEIGDNIISLNEKIKLSDYSMIDDKKLVFVVPTYAWSIPHIVEDWIYKTDFNAGSEVYFVLTCGADVGNAVKEVNKIVENKKFILKGFSKIIMPENYIVFFSAPDNNTAIRQIDIADKKALKLAKRIMQGDDIKPKRANLLGRVFTLLNPMFYKVAIKAKPFKSDNRCISCGKCKAVCPLNNIIISDGEPIWGDYCTHCMACISSCPTESIEYGQKTQGKRRYICPELR